MLNYPKPQQPIPPQSYPMVPYYHAPIVSAPRVLLQDQVPAPPPRVHPMQADPSVDPISRRTRSHTQTAEQPVDQRMRSQIKQSLTVTPYQASQQYLDKALLSLWYNHVTALATLVLKFETGESLEYCQLQHHPKYKKILE